MKKFKPNMMSRIILQFLEVCLPHSIFAPIMLVLMEKEDITVFWNIFLSILPVFIILIFVLNFINLIIQLSKNDYVFLYNEHFVHNGTTVNYCNRNRARQR